MSSVLLPQRPRPRRKGKKIVVIVLLIIMVYLIFLHAPTARIIFSKRPLLTKTLLLTRYLAVTSGQVVWRIVVVCGKSLAVLWDIWWRGWGELSGQFSPTVDIRTHQELYALYQQVAQWSGLPWQVFWGIHAEETRLGQNLGETPVIKVLPENQKSYFYQICREQHWDPQQVYGSYKGAFGPFQFMPETWARHAVDGDGDGRKDPFNVTDAAYSAANYLLHKGGRDDLPKAIWHYNQDPRYVKRVLRYLRYS
jgi:hypothetical protein